VRKDDEMDICQYVKFKKIPGGNKSDCEMISGVVFTKNIANKKMASVLNHPKILVLSCAIDYQVSNTKELDFLAAFLPQGNSIMDSIGRHHPKRVHFLHLRCMEGWGNLSPEKTADVLQGRHLSPRKATSE